MTAKEIQYIRIDQVDCNNGQIEGLPKNPRDIYEEEYESLIQSLKEDPEMLHLHPLMVFPYNGAFVAICGNMRLQALRMAGVEEVPCTVLDADTSIEDLRAYTMLDNIHAGDWSDDLKEWDKEELESWDVNYKEPVTLDTDEQAEPMVQMSITFDSEDFKRVKQHLNRFDKDSGRAILMMFAYGEQL